MMELDLGAPIYLARQLAQMESSVGLSMDQLEQLAYHTGPALGIITEDSGQYHKFDLISLEEIRKKDEDSITYQFRRDLTGIPYLTGAKGVLWLCEQKGLSIAPLTKVSIPHDVFRECDKDQWFDISSFYSDLELRNNRVVRLAGLGVPDAIMLPETRILWEKVELLESGQLGNRVRRWTHGRVMRSLNDIGYSLADGWSAGMRELFETIDDEGREAIDARRRARYKQMVDHLIAMYEKRGMTYPEALIKAHDEAKGKPSTRPASLDGMGIQVYDPFPGQVVADFLKNHRNSFIQSDIEQRIYDRILAGEDPDTVFGDSDYELDGPEYACDHWAVAITNVMIRETGLSFGVHIADPDGKYNNRSCILYADKSPWQYNEKEHKLSRNMLYQILDRYALELGLSVWENAYFVLDIEDN